MIALHRVLEVEVKKNNRHPHFELTFRNGRFYYKNMLVCFHLIAFLAHEYFTPEWQKDARDITREVVAAMLEADEVFYQRSPPKRNHSCQS